MNTTTITDLRDQLLAVFDGLRDGTVMPKDAIEINNTAGKVINSAKVQLAYAALRGEAPNIPFLVTEVGHTKATRSATPSEVLISTTRRHAKEMAISAGI